MVATPVYCIYTGEKGKRNYFPLSQNLYQVVPGLSDTHENALLTGVERTCISAPNARPGKYHLVAGENFSLADSMLVTRSN